MVFATFTLFLFKVMDKAAKIVADSIICMDIESVIVGGKAYNIKPPTIYKIAGATSCLSQLDFKEGATVKDIFLSMKDSGQYVKALSWFIKGDESLSGELGKGTYEEVINALEKAYEMISPKVFLRAVNLARNVSRLTAKQKQ